MAGFHALTIHASMLKPWPLLSWGRQQHGELVKVSTGHTGAYRMLTTGQIDSVDDVMFLMVKINGFIQVVPVSQNRLNFWLVVSNIFYFQYIGNNNPFWLIFFRGVGIPPTNFFFLSLFFQQHPLNPIWIAPWPGWITKAKNLPIPFDSWHPKKIPGNARVSTSHFLG